MKNIIKNRLIGQRGFTLAEFLVSSLIFSILAAGLYMTSVTAQKSWMTNKLKVEMQQSVRTSMEHMIDELRQAGSSSIVDVPADGTWYNQITFKIPTGVASRSITWTANNIRYVLGGGAGVDIIRQEVGVSSSTVATDFSLLQFRRAVTTPNTVEVNMTAQRQTYQGENVVLNFDFTVQLRNT